jgi:ribosomal protein S1
VADFVKVGDEITSYVFDIDEERGRITLTMTKPPARTWTELQVGDVVKATIVRIEKYGAFADIGAERPGLIHVSELADDYVGSPNTVVNVGDVVDAKIINIDRKKKQIDLSIRQVELGVMKEDNQEENLTSMGMALRQALAGSSDSRGDKKRNKKKDRRRDRDEQSHIIARTLHYHDDK